MNLTLKTRRQFLHSALAGGALSWSVPTFLAHAWQVLGADPAQVNPDLPTLVVLQLAGGNDGLNTLVPWSNDHYRRARPRLALPDKDLLKINEDLAFHPALRGFNQLLDQGHLAVVQGVGYPNPNRSHFRSMEIWHTASDADQFERHGWIGRYFDHSCPGADPVVGVHLGRELPQAFSADHPTGITLSGPLRGSRFRPEAMSPAPSPSNRGVTTADDRSPAQLPLASAQPSTPGEALLDYLDRTALDAELSDRRVREILRQSQGGQTYPETALGQSLQRISQLIVGGLPTRIYYLSQGGYDTHANQAGTHARLLGELGDAVHAFIQDLRHHGQLNRVLVLAFSEFGRRVADNASGGTDHGAAGPVFLFGHRFLSPLLGQSPSLAPEDLLRGDPRFQVDFRQVYAAVLRDFLKTQPLPILGQPFDGFSFV